MNKIFLSIVCIALSSYTIQSSSGFEAAFKKNLQKKKKSPLPLATPILDQNTPHIEAEPLKSNEVPVQIIENRRYVSINSDLQGIIRNHLKKSGEFDKHVIQVASFLIKQYHDLNNKPVNIHLQYMRQQDKNDLIPHLQSVNHHLKEAQQIQGVLDLQKQINTIVKNHQK